MTLWDMKLLCSLCLVAGVVGQHVTYPDPVCAVNGSTVTLGCTFKPRPLSGNPEGTTGFCQIRRVVWCQNHEICHGTTPSVYDSKSQRNNRKYRYLGNMEDNCSLQIKDIEMRDSAVYRFRMEADDTYGHFTGKSGVKVTVIDGVRMTVSSSTGDKDTSEGNNVTLRCTARCTFYGLEVTWYRDGHTLSESGPTLQLSPVTALHSGNYTCALRTNASSRSQPHRLHVKAAPEEKQKDLMLIVAVTVGVLLPVVLVIVAIIIIIIIKRYIYRKHTEAASKPHRIVGKMEEQKHLEHIYSNTEQPGRLEETERQQGASQAAEDVSYAFVQFKPNKESRQKMEANDVVYTSVASRR